jgi:hypothetical protein
VKRGYVIGLSIGLLLFLLWLLPAPRTFMAGQLFRIALSPSMGAVVGWGFEHASPLLPVKQVLLTDKTVAFYHPRPRWQRHILRLNMCFKGMRCC